VNPVQVDSYRDLAGSGVTNAVSPTSRPFLSLAQSLNLKLEPARGFCSSREDWAKSRGKGYLLETFYRNQRKRLNLLMDGDNPQGEQWNFENLFQKQV
jgi:deoxyribodipyrimidine photolyase-related protein